MNGVVANLRLVDSRLGIVHRIDFWGRYVPAFPAFDFDRPIYFLLGAKWLFIFEPNGLHFGGPATGYTFFDVAAIQPALVRRLAGDIFWAAHLVVQHELFHKAIIWLT
jgi:hypothetical protein